MLDKRRFLSVRRTPVKVIMSQLSFLTDDEIAPRIVDWEPTRVSGLSRLKSFVPRAGKAYAKLRNFDDGPDQRSNVSCLSPFIRHRLVLEQEVVVQTLAKHSVTAAEKFLQEVFWRSYFKGWLEQHQSVWHDYSGSVRRQVERLEGDAALCRRYDQAIAGRTGIDCFDTWAHELVETGYLHNHTRMWFASIWIFTLQLPWQLGADFFYRHLIDADPASNTLSWRWVGGLHTKGKNYLARASNIARFTNNRFNPVGALNETAPPLADTQLPNRNVLPAADQVPDDVRYGLLITEEDCNAESLALRRSPDGLIALAAPHDRSPLAIGEAARKFAHGAVEDAALRATDHFQTIRFEQDEARSWRETLLAFAQAMGVQTIVTPYAPVGPVAAQLAVVRRQLSDAGIRLLQVRRPYDDAAWPHATDGFFKLKARIPSLVADL